MDLISTNRSRWIVKAIVEFSILVFVTMLIVLMKYPRLIRVSDKQEDHSIFAIRAYCKNPNCPEPQIKAICSNLAEERNRKQGDPMGFFSAATFSLYIFSTSMLLKLREEYGLFYMCLELTMNAAVEIPGIGGSILNWYYVGPTTFYCFLLIIVRCYYHSSDEVRRRGGNGDDDNDGDDGDRRHTEAVLELVGEELRQPDLELNEQGDGDDGAEGGGGGGRKDGDQGRRTDLGSAGTDWEIESDEEDSSGDHRKLIGIILLLFLYTCLYILSVALMVLSYKEVINGVIHKKYLSIAVITLVSAIALLLKTSRIASNIASGFVTRILRQLELEMNQEEDSHHDGADGGEGGRKTGDQGHSAGRVRKTMSAEEGDEHKAERAEGTSRVDEIERIISTNILREREITRKKQEGPSDEEKFPAAKSYLYSGRKSSATGSNFYGKSVKSLSTEKED